MGMSEGGEVVAAPESTVDLTGVVSVKPASLAVDGAHPMRVQVAH